MPDEDKYYAIKEADLVAIADRTRTMANLTEPLSIQEIIYWLSRVTYIPQGHASSEFTMNSINFETGIIGILPNVVRASATSIFTLASINFETSAVEYIEEG